MQLTFRYPPGWRTAGRTFMASMGNVGGAEVIGGTSATFAAFRSAGTCASRIALVGKGVYIAWGENIGGPSPIKLSARPGDPLRVNGHPARLADTTSTNCFGLHGRVLSGTIQVATNRFLFMNALIGKGAPAEMVSQVRDLFASARR